MDAESKSFNNTRKMAKYQSKRSKSPLYISKPYVFEPSKRSGLGAVREIMHFQKVPAVRCRTLRLTEVRFVFDQNVAFSLAVCLSLYAVRSGLSRPVRRVL